MRTDICVGCSYVYAFGNCAVSWDKALPIHTIAHAQPRAKLTSRNTHAHCMRLWANEIRKGRMFLHVLITIQVSPVLMLQTKWKWIYCFRLHRWKRQAGQISPCSSSSTWWCWWWASRQCFGSAVKRPASSGPVSSTGNAKKSESKFLTLLLRPYFVWV